MTRTISLATGLALVLSSAALAQAPEQTSTPMTSAPQAGTTAQQSDTPAHLSATDRRFVAKATAGGMTEVEESQLAQTKAKEDSIKSFAEKMVQDHTSADDKLKSLADEAGVQPPSEPDAAARKQMAALRKLSGKAFDRRYVQDQLAAHKATVALFQKEAASGSDPQLRQFASETLPTIKEHLTDVQGLTGRNAQ